MHHLLNTRFVNLFGRGMVAENQEIYKSLTLNDSYVMILPCPL